MTQASRDLEILVAKIQQQLAPQAEVLHDVKLDGRHSGRKRQIDVLVREKIGQYEIKIVMDCKDYKSPVDVKGVEEFAGLLDDVGAQKGVLVCPKGFSAAAKTRAEKLQINLYSPVDTDPHKWKATVTMPAICDFRLMEVSFCLSSSAPFPMKFPMDFYSSQMIFDADGVTELGFSLDRVTEKWNSGKFPMEIGLHKALNVFDRAETLMDNGYGRKIPFTITVDTFVKAEIYYGQLPVPKMSGFRNELSGMTISNAFTVGILSPEEVEKDWLKIDSIEDAPVKPVIVLTGSVMWGDAESD